jgi:hypothetical protein
MDKKAGFLIVCLALVYFQYLTDIIGLQTQ